MEKCDVFPRLTLRGWRWFWNYESPNGNKMADGGEGYVNKEDAIDALLVVRRRIAEAPIFILDRMGARVSQYVDHITTDMPAPKPKPARKKPHAKKR